LRGALEQLELVLEDLEQQVAKTAPPAADEPTETDPETPRRKPARKPSPDNWLRVSMGMGSPRR
jgi:hypothetical protein